MQIALRLAVGAGEGEGWGARRAGATSWERKWWQGRAGRTRAARSSRAAGGEREGSSRWHAGEAAGEASRLGAIRVVARAKDSVEKVTESWSCCMSEVEKC